MLALEKLKQPVDWRELSKIATDPEWEIELGMEIPPFPVQQPTQVHVHKRRKTGISRQDSKNGAGEDTDPSMPHIPVFMPPLPERHTYCNSKKDAVERERDRKTIGERRLEQKRQAQNSLSKMQRHSVYQQHRHSLFGSNTTVASNPFIMTPVKEEKPNSSSSPKKQDQGASKQLDLFGPPSQPLHPSTSGSEQKEQQTLHPSDVSALSKEEKILRGLYNDEEDNM